MTETYRAGADGQQKTAALLRTLSLLLEDLLLLNAGTPELVRNIDLRAEFGRLAAALPFPWIERASHALDQVHSGLRRNLLRSLSLDAFAETTVPGSSPSHPDRCRIGPYTARPVPASLPADSLRRVHASHPTCKTHSPTGFLLLLSRQLDPGVERSFSYDFISGHNRRSASLLMPFVYSAWMK